MTSVFAFKADDEAGRLAALRRYDVLDSEPETEFVDIVKLLGTMFAMPFAAINLLDECRNWPLAIEGALRVADARKDAFCNIAIQSLAPLVVENAALDPRFCDNVHVTGPAGVRAYLGMPLTTPDGYNIGAICVWGTEPRRFSEADVEVLRNLAKVVMSQFELRMAAKLDALTDAMTRRAFDTRLQRVTQSPEADVSSVILLDIDHFKSVNDTFGHGVGDMVLKAVAQTISGLIGRGEAFARLGGEEFAILMPGASALAAQGLAERIQQALLSLVVPQLQGRRVTMSLGIAQRLAQESSLAWLERADKALYGAKSQGRDRIALAAAA